MAAETTRSGLSRPAAEPAERTIGKLWRDAAAKTRDYPAYLAETPDGWQPVQWDEAATAVDELANGLLALGIRKGDSFGILAQTRVEWALFDFALGLVGAVGAAIYANSAPRDCEYVLEHAEAIGVLVEDEAQREKVAAFAEREPRLQHVLTFADLAGLRERGRAFAAAHPGALDDAAAAVTEDDVFTYIYTSGTTGPPKACTILHRNYYAMVTCIDDVPDFYIEGDTMLLYLPLAHNFGRLMHLSGPYAGYTVAFLANPQRVGNALPEVRPTILPSVPRVYEKVHTAVLGQFDAATGAKRKIIDRALRTGYRVSALRERGAKMPPLLALQHRLADRLVYSKVKEKLGGRLRFGISGGAPLSPDVARFFHALDILILEGYGLTECTTASNVNRPTRYRFGTVGPAVPNAEVRLADDGEVLIKGPTLFAGYFKDEPATREVLTDDGWLRTGDIGVIDEDGFLTITDRKKDILVTAGGKNVAPANLENELKASRFVSQALIVGDRKPYIAALITLDEPEILKWAQARGITGDIDALAADEQVRELVQGVVDGVNAEHSRFEQIKRFTILPRDFSIDEGEITQTLKLKRRVVFDHFAADVDRLYA